ncbi:MAG: multiheme c-type cytochrome [Desulfuromonadaceae bacterium]|nr:multiheme c-type cytochrome [Desulfuromonadaceae bacterium]
MISIKHVLSTVVCTALLSAAPVLAADSKKEFVGSETCKKCHSAQFKSWKESYHSKMVRKQEDGILKAVVEKWATDGTNPGPVKGNVTGKDFKLADVVYVVGSKWKQRFLVKDDTTGGYQFLNKQFNRMSGQWEGYGNKNDWDTNCTTCHTTGYRLIKYDPADPKAQKYEWSEMNVGCEACHGPGVKHVKSRSKKDIFSFAGKTKAEQSLVCGYCHNRIENEQYKTLQGNAREDLPAPKVGDTFKPGDDWTKWYPEHAVMPGLQAEDKIDGDYHGDLKGLFLKDDKSKEMGAYDAGKHHQQYQDFIQSKHFKENILSCVDCHGGLHAGKKGPAKDAKASCASCHDASYTVEKYMPGTGGTVKNLFVRTHTFNKKQTRPGGPTAKGEPEYNKK